VVVVVGGLRPIPTNQSTNKQLTLQTTLNHTTQTRLNTKVQTAMGAKPAAAVAAVATADAATYMEGGWARRGKGSAFFRTLEIWGNAVQFLLKEVKVRKIKDVAEQRAERRKVAVFARECLLKLGPTFIKFGQLLSTRIDILPKEYTEELSLLQDSVPGFSGAVAMEVIRQELGRPVDELFEWFDPNPLAAASLGQVHRARFQGEELAIKIQRQGLRELFDLDLKNLKVLAVLLDKFDPKSDGAARDWKSIYEESAKLLYKEIDYENEGRNAERFAKDFKDIPWVKVPKIYWDFTSKRVLAMEYCPGIKVSDVAKIEAAGIDRKLLAQRSAESYLYQLCRCVFFWVVWVWVWVGLCWGLSLSLSCLCLGFVLAWLVFWPAPVGHMCLYSTRRNHLHPYPRKQTTAGTASSTATRTRATWRARRSWAGGSSTTTSG